MWLARKGGVPALSLANRSATHAMRSGVDERLVANAGNARDDLVSDRSVFRPVVHTYKLAV
jgi:hypothetical protein